MNSARGAGTLRISVTGREEAAASALYRLRSLRRPDSLRGRLWNRSADGLVVDRRRCQWSAGPDCGHVIFCVRAARRLTDVRDLADDSRNLVRRQAS